MHYLSRTSWSVLCNISCAKRRCFWSRDSGLRFAHVICVPSGERRKITQDTTVGLAFGCSRYVYNHKHSVHVVINRSCSSLRANPYNMRIGMRPSRACQTYPPTLIAERQLYDSTSVHRLSNTLLVCDPSRFGMSRLGLVSSMDASPHPAYPTSPIPSPTTTTTSTVTVVVEDEQQTDSGLSMVRKGHVRAL